MIAKKRHKFFTIWLRLVVIINIFNAGIYFFKTEFLQQAFPHASINVLYFCGALSLCNTVCAVALLKLKKWGLYGFLLAMVVSIYPSVFTHLISPSAWLLSSLLFLGCLYLALNLGKENKAWYQLT